MSAEGRGDWLERMMKKYDVYDPEELTDALSLEDLCVAYSLKERKISYIPYGKIEPEVFTIHASDVTDGSFTHVYVKDVLRMVFGPDCNMKKYAAPFRGSNRCPPAHCLRLQEAWYPSGMRHLSIMVYDPNEYMHFMTQGGMRLIINQLKGAQSNFDFLASVKNPILELKTLWNDHLKSHAQLNNLELFEELIAFVRRELNGVV